MPTVMPQDIGEARAAHAQQRLWQQLVDADDAAGYCRAWLALLVAELDRVDGALVLLRDDTGAYVPAAVWPDAEADVGYLGGIAQRCLGARAPVAERVPPADGQSGDAPGRLYAAFPIELGDDCPGAVVLDLAPRPEPELKALWRRLHWGAGRLESLLYKRKLDLREATETRSRFALDLAVCVDEEPDFERALMQIANTLAQRLDCERVAIGIERRGRIRLRALSGAAWFERKADFSVALENAMEEACDQSRTVVHPPAPLPGSASAGGTVAVAHRAVAPRDGGACTAVIRVRGRCIGAISCLTEGPCTADMVAALEAATAILAPNITLRSDLQRWFAGRMADGVRAFWRGCRDHRRLSFRVGAGLVVAALAWLALADGAYRVTGEALIEGEQQRALVAPFEGFIATAAVRAGQRVASGDVLARLDDRDLRLEEQKWLAQREQAERKYRDALGRRDRPNARILAAELAEVRAQLDLVQDKLARAVIIAPFEGIVVSGDLTQILGTPVEKGKVLFEVAPLDAYRVILRVSERDIRPVRPGQSGQIVLAGLAGERIPFIVSNIGIATAEAGENLFRIEAELAEAGVALRPGMEGVGKIEIGERRLVWIWTHRFFDWLGLKLWQWLP